MTACDRILRLASWLAPADLRADWLREWRGEVGFAVAQHRRNGNDTTAARALLIVRCIGAFAHAAWLRWDRWRLEMLLQDIRHAVRSLRKRPGFAAVTILTLALGVGANAAIFSAVRAVLLRPLPFPDPDRLVQVFSTSVKAPNRTIGAASPPDFYDWRRDSRSFSELAAFNAGSFALTGQGDAEQIPGANVTAHFFDVLGVRALYGRSLQASDDVTGAPEVAVIGHALWMRRFGGDPSIVDRTITFDGVPHRIVGVMPHAFAFPLQSEMWVPQKFTERDLATQRGAHYLDVIGRLREGASVEQARAEMTSIAIRLAEAHPSTNKDNRISVHGLRDAIAGDFRTPLLILLGAVGFVLLIVCVNVAGLFLTRALGRTRELAVRAALGAGRFRLVRGVVVESVLLALAGGAGGLALAYVASDAIAAVQRGVGIPLLDETRVDRVVVVFTATLSFVAALAFGAFPAWHTSSVGDVARRIREDSATATGDRQKQRLRSALIIVETALAVVLLVGAGLLLRSFLAIASVALGFDGTGVQTFTISLPEARYQQPSQRAAFVDSLMRDIGGQPGVEAAGAVFGLPLTGFGYSISMSTLDGRKLDDDEQMARSLQVRVATPDYFRSMGIPIVRGRAFSESDRLGSEQVVLVNETAAHRLWPNDNPLGHHFTLGTRMGQGGANSGGTVIGVARDVRDFGPTLAVRPAVYLAHAQSPVSFMTVTVRTRGEPGNALELLRTVVAAADRDLPMFRVRTMDQIAADAVAQPRVYLGLLGLFALTALLLAAVGIYSVLSHAVSQRTREIGIRLALGAGRGTVMRMVLGQAALLAAIGLALGLGLAAGTARLARRLLYGIEPTDAATYVLVALGLFIIAFLASYVPARRAGRVNPVTALRCE
jgi:putative ABC transport system permease protein